MVRVTPPTRHDPRTAIDVVAADRPGLLARVTRVLADAGLSIDNAVVATWPDGAALESFLVLDAMAPEDAGLRAAIVEAIAAPLTVEPVVGARATFDDTTSPWYSLVRVDTDDGPGRLSAIAGALAAAGVDVHSADIREHGGLATDVFEVTGARGKLRPAERDAVVAALDDGAVLEAPQSWRSQLWHRLRSSWVSGDGQDLDMETSSL